MIDSNIKVKHAKLSIKQKVKGTKDFLLTRNVDVLFVFMASFLLTKYAMWERVLFSIGLTYIYKVMIKEIKTIKMIKREK